MNKTYLLISFFILFLNSAGAQDCNYQVDLAGSLTGSLKREQRVVEESFTITRPNNSSTPRCQNTEIYFGKGQANSYERKAYSGTSSVDYNIYASSALGSVLKDYPDANPGEFISVLTPDRNVPISKSFFIKLVSLDSVFSTRPGVYNDVVPVNFYSRRNNGQIELQTTRFISILIEVPRFVELSLVPENSPHNPNSTSYMMNFGQMNSGQELGADLRVVGNVGFGVMMSSANGSKLVHANDSVDYQIKVGQAGYQSLAPAGALYQVAKRNQSTSLDGQRYNLKVRLDQVDESLKSGTYEDVITITIQAW